MENKKHRVYQSLIRKPKIAGLSHGLFSLLVGCILIIILIAGKSWIGIGAALSFGYFLHQNLRKAEDKDDLFLTLWIGKIFKGDNHYKAKAPIDHSPGKKPKSIPTLH